MKATWDADVLAANAAHSRHCGLMLADPKLGAPRSFCVRDIEYRCMVVCMSEIDAHEQAPHALARMLLLLLVHAQAEGTLAYQT